MLPLPMQRYDMKSQNANQWRKYFPKMRLVVFARLRLLLPPELFLEIVIAIQATAAISIKTR